MRSSIFIITLSVCCKAACSVLCMRMFRPRGKWRRGAVFLCEGSVKLWAITFITEINFRSALNTCQNSSGNTGQQDFVLTVLLFLNDILISFKNIHNAISWPMKSHSLSVTIFISAEVTWDRERPKNTCDSPYNALNYCIRSFIIFTPLTR
jgi:hypothetical protein